MKNRRLIRYGGAGYRANACDRACLQDMWDDRRRCAADARAARRLGRAVAHAARRARSCGHRLGRWRTHRDSRDAFAFCQRCAGVVVVTPPPPDGHSGERGTAAGPAIEGACSPRADVVDAAIDLCALNAMLPWAAEYGLWSLLSQARR